MSLLRTTSCRDEAAAVLKVWIFNRYNETYMETTKNPDPKVRDPFEITKISFELFKFYLDELEKEFGDITCNECGNQLWNIFRAPVPEGAEEKPNVVTFPMPFSPGVGMWSFPISCSRCGSMRFFEASAVYDGLRKHGKL